MRGMQIPAFGKWEDINDDLPITQYFESARQAGLLRFSSDSADSAAANPSLSSYSAHLYGGAASHHRKPPSTATAPPRPKHLPGKGRENRGGGTHVKEGNRKQAGKVFDVTVTELPPQVQAAAAAKRHPPAVKKQHQFQYDDGLDAQPRRASKAVDEDLYKIPPELLKRKRRLGFISRCLVPPCAV